MKIISRKFISTFLLSIGLALIFLVGVHRPSVRPERVLDEKGVAVRGNDGLPIYDFESEVYKSKLKPYNYMFYLGLLSIVTGLSIRLLGKLKRKKDNNK
jgi:hypothetical protein